MVEQISNKDIKYENYKRPLDYKLSFDVSHIQNNTTTHNIFK